MLQDDSIWKSKDRTKTLLRNKMHGIRLLTSKTYYKAIVNKTLLNWPKIKKQINLIALEAACIYENSTYNKTGTAQQ